MARIKGGFITNYLSDLTFPAWFYIYIRGLTNVNQKPQLIFFKDWFGALPERALISILFIGVITELKTLFWPSGIISGTFDFIDILAYTIGLIICYYFDKRK